ncbi:MAG: exonuclease SbcCD subunit D C-terminal domain-containing protein [Ignavibacteriae bacterium]|nr:exonuclease SbcCD subunit D C-terminal domain-containing protein [Ignavibacteriota bacterium]
MTILHTADWHLGQHFGDHDRREEHQNFLNRLVGIIRERKVDAVIHAGDVFDVFSPPKYAEEMYYNFLREMVLSECNNIVITGGNHDSAATLNAPAKLLKSLNIHIIGCATDNISDQIIELVDSDGKVIGAVAAVPFLRDKDLLREAISGESYDDRTKRIAGGIHAHYERSRDEILTYKQQGLPVIATGHLFVSGGTTSDSEKDIHIGNIGQIGAEIFPIEFDYIALGHLHRPQIVNKQSRIRYSGSPIPLSFSEITDKKQILLVEFQPYQEIKIETIEIPKLRQLIRFQGDFEAIIAAISGFSLSEGELPALVEVIIELDAFNPDMDRQVRELAEGNPNLEIFKVRPKYLDRFSSITEQFQNIPDLDDLNPIDVFSKKMESLGMDENSELMETFRQLLEYKHQQEII